MTYSASVGARVLCDRCGSERQRVLDGDFEDARRSQRALAPGDHGTLIYDDPEAVAPFCARFLTDGVKRGERVVAGLQDDLREAVSELLALDVTRSVEWKEPREIYGDFAPDRVAARYEDLISDDPRTARILAGFDAESAEGVPPEELARYEELAHAIITAHGATVVCVYDRTTLPRHFAEVSALRHGLTVDDDAVRRNERFEYQPAF